MVHLIGMWWPPHSSISAALHAATFLSLAVSTLYFFLQSLLEGPGFVPLGWRPVSKHKKTFNKKKLQLLRNTLTKKKHLNSICNTNYKSKI